MGSSLLSNCGAATIQEMDAELQKEYSHRAVWNIAAPMILSWISVPLLGLVDTAVVGHLEGPEYLAAVAAGAAIFSVLFAGLNFLRMGTTGVAAQAFGARDDQAINASLLQPLLLAIALTLTLLVLREPLKNLGLNLLAPSVLVADYTEIYFDIRIWSAPAMLINLVMLGWLLGMQYARAALVMILVINLSNIALDLWFVLGLGWNVDGVARATVIAEYMGTVTGFCYVYRILCSGATVRVNKELLRLTGFQRLIAINGNLFMRSVALMFTFAFITAQGARIGDATLAANAVLMNFLYFFAYATDGLANAAEALTGKAVGSRNADALKLAVDQTMKWGIAFMIGFVLLYGITGEHIIALLTNIDDVRATASIYLPWLVLLPLASVVCFLYDGVYVGTTRSREMMIVMLLSVLLVFLPTWFLLRELGNHALWAALFLFMALRSLGMHIWFRRMQQQRRLIPA